MLTFEIKLNKDEESYVDAHRKEWDAQHTREYVYTINRHLYNKMYVEGYTGIFWLIDHLEKQKRTKVVKSLIKKMKKEAYIQMKKEKGFI